MVRDVSMAPRDLFGQLVGQSSHLDGDTIRVQLLMGERTRRLRRFARLVGVRVRVRVGVGRESVDVGVGVDVRRGSVGVGRGPFVIACICTAPSAPHRISAVPGSLLFLTLMTVVGLYRN